MSDYRPTVSWGTVVGNVSVHATAFNFICNVPFDSYSDPGYGTVAVGYYLADYVGNIYEIMEINVDGDSTKIRIYDIHEQLGYVGPMENNFGYVYDPIVDGQPIIPPIDIHKLSYLALDNIRTAEQYTYWTNRGLQIIDSGAVATDNVTKAIYSDNFKITPAASGWNGGNDIAMEFIIPSGVSGNFISVDGSENLQDSGYKDSDYVHIAGAENITGAKTFDVATQFDGNVTIGDSSPTTLRFRINNTQWIDGILDEDNFASNDDRALATQQSIKAYVLANVNQGSFLDSVLYMQTNATTPDPGGSPTTGDRYILLDIGNLHANFGSIAGVGDDDIVEYDGADFVVVFDSSAAGAGVTVTVGTDKNGETDHDWYYNTDDDDWYDRGSATIHNNLTGKQGGNGTNEFYHLTSDDHDLVVAITSTATELNYLDGTVVTAGGILFGDSSKITQDNSNLFWDNSNKRLGVGIDVPLVNLDIRGNLNSSLLYLVPNTDAASGYVEMRFYTDDNPVASPNRYAAIRGTTDGTSRANNELYFFTGAGDGVRSVKMILDKLGYLGIGGDPTTNLQVNGALNSDILRLVPNTDAASGYVEMRFYTDDDPVANPNRYAAIRGTTDGTSRNVDELAFITGSGDGTRSVKMILDKLGYLGIGVNPTTALDIAGTITTDSHGTSTNWYAAYNHISNNGSDHSFIDQDVTNGSSPVFTNTNMTGNISVWTNNSGFITASDVTYENLSANSDIGTGAAQVSQGNHNHSGVYEPIISSGTTAQYWRGDKTWQTLNKASVGLGNVENTALSTWTGSGGALDNQYITNGAGYITSAITSLGGLSGASQTFAIGTSGTTPSWSSATTIHTLNIPLASASGVTAGLISRVKYDEIVANTSASHAASHTIVSHSDTAATGTQLNTLVGAGNTSLHYHSADRARAVHTGTQVASTISDFDTEVSNNSSVSSNTSHRGLTDNPHEVVWSDVSSGHTASEHDGLNIISAQGFVLGDGNLVASDKLLVYENGSAIKKMDITVLQTYMQSNLSIPTNYITNNAADILQLTNNSAYELINAASVSNGLMIYNTSTTAGTATELKLRSGSYDASITAETGTGMCFYTEINSFTNPLMTLDDSVKVDGQQYSSLNVLGEKGASFSTDLNDGNVISFTIVQDLTLNNPSNMKSGGTYIWIITQDGDGSREMSYGNYFKFADGYDSELAQGATDISVLTGVAVSSILIYCNLLKNFVSP